ncbi:MAG: hypothetical protein M3410_05935 [Acidobacteriota bacterium]|nr:hypothetical protein [Acidobacteriota bacterium]
MQSRFENDSWLYNPKLYQRAGCVLQADGVGFEAEKFVRHTSFNPKLILYHEKIGFPEEFKLKMAGVEPSGLDFLETTFLLLEVSQAETKETQISEATSFFEQYRDEVKRLRDFPQVENMTLKFMTAEGESSREDLPDEFMEMVMSRGVTGIMF